MTQQKNCPSLCYIISRCIANGQLFVKIVTLFRLLFSTIESTHLYLKLHSVIDERKKKNEAKFTSSPCARLIDQKGSFSSDIVSRHAFYRRFPSVSYAHMINCCLFLSVFSNLLLRHVVYVTDATYRDSF